MLVIVSKILSIFLIAAVGFVANRKGILPNEANQFLVDLLMKVVCPCMIINAIAGTELKSDTMTLTLEMIAFSILFFIVGTVVAYIICAKVLKIQKDDNLGIYMLCMTAVNNGFMGFPITYALFGSEALFLMVFFQIILIMYAYVGGVLLVNMGERKGGGFISKLKPLANGNTVAAVFGIFLLFSGLTLPAFLGDSIKLIGDATVPLSMIVVGMQLGNSNIKKIVKNKKLVWVSALKMILWPVLTFAVVYPMPLGPIMKIALIFGATFPTAVMVVPIASSEGKDAVLAAEMVAFTTLISMITLPVCAIILNGLLL